MASLSPSAAKLNSYQAAHNTEQAVLAEPPVDADGNIVLDEVDVKSHRDGMGR
ncbi:hypothetical protein [uncultured Psychrobacter sp.]|uniref:hypothetical protein n=1 Tax=uncultured Psychrobacter sp. TaxID=259303 RepID=UPI00261FA647|nr:hypothetical protein [uncultured Psychrobacter sp.]